MNLEDESRGESVSNRVAGIEIPQSTIAREAYKTAAILLPDVLSGHAQRVFVFAALTSQQRRPACDFDLLYVAAMFMTVGLNLIYAFSQRRYEVDSAEAVQQFLAEHDISDSAALDVWYAVALHTTHGIPDYASPLAASLAAGVHMDLFGERASAVSHDLEMETLRMYPRGERFKERFIAAIGRGVAHRPASTFASASADVLDRLDPDYRRVNYCGLILGAKWTD